MERKEQESQKSELKRVKNKSVGGGLQFLVVVVLRVEWILEGFALNATPPIFETIRVMF